jgi:hypothetical protein
MGSGTLRTHPCQDECALTPLDARQTWCGVNRYHPSGLVAHGLLNQVARRAARGLAAVLTLGVRHRTEGKYMVAMEETAMEGLLICSGMLAIIVGLLAVIEGTLGWLGSMWHKKDPLCSAR